MSLCKRRRINFNISHKYISTCACASTQTYTQTKYTDDDELLLRALKRTVEFSTTVKMKIFWHLDKIEIFQLSFKLYIHTYIRSLQTLTIIFSMWMSVHIYILLSCRNNNNNKKKDATPIYIVVHIHTSQHITSKGEETFIHFTHLIFVVFVAHLFLLLLFLFIFII